MTNHINQTFSTKPNGNKPNKEYLYSRFVTKPTTTLPPVSEIKKEPSMRRPLTTLLLRQHVVASLTPHCGVNDVTLGNACRRNQFTKNGRDRLMGWLKAGVRRVEALKDLHYNLANLAPPRNLSHFYQRQQHAAGL